MLIRSGVVVGQVVKLLLISLVSLPLQAAKFTIPDSFEFLALDGKAISSSLLSHQSELTLSEGKHEITLRYKDVVIDPDLGYESVINSRPFVISLQVNSGSDYQLEPEPVAFKDKQTFAKNPQVTVHSQGASQPLHVAADQGTRPEVLIVKEPVAGKVSSKQVSEIKVPVKANVSVGEQLQYWWLKADKQTRDAFMSWVISR
ncbi:MAG: DUF2057 domain-containing protein [Candidatus Thiodiazotropha sp. DIVDIV]